MQCERTESRSTLVFHTVPKAGRHKDHPETLRKSFLRCHEIKEDLPQEAQEIDYGGPENLIQKPYFS